MLLRSLIAANRQRKEPSKYTKGFKTFDDALGSMDELKATPNHPLSDPDTYNTEFYKLEDYFNNISAYDSFKSDYDDIMKGL